MIARGVAVPEVSESPPEARAVFPRAALIVAAALLCAPLLAACVRLYLDRRQLAPLFDMAIIEMRVRAVGTSNTPLLGLGGRLGRPWNCLIPTPVRRSYSPSSLACARSPSKA